MSPRVEIVREDASRLRRKIWLFWYYDHLHALLLDGYNEGSRPTTRHKYTTDRAWVRINNRRGYAPGTLIPDEEAGDLVPQDVKSEAAAKFAEALRVGLQEELQKQQGPAFIR